MKPVLIVRGIDGLRHLAFDFEADEIRLDELPPRNAEPFAHRETRRERRNRRVRQQPEDAIGRRRKLRVIEIERVPCGAVYECGRCGTACERVAAEHREMNAGLPSGELFARIEQELLDDPDRYPTLARYYDPTR